MSRSPLELKPTSDFQYSNLFIRAGAGAGKTTQLIQTFFDFVQAFQASQNRMPKIIMTTFTRKATQEVKERLMVKALETGQSDLFEYINKKSMVHISTIHGVLGLFLKKNFEYAGLSAQFKIIDDFKNDRRVYRILKKLIKENNQYSELLEHYRFKELVNHVVDVVEQKAQRKNLLPVDEQDLKSARGHVLKRFTDVIHELIAIRNGLSSKPWTEYISALESIAALIEKNEIDAALAAAENLDKKPSFKKQSPPFDESLHDQLLEMIDSKDGLLWHLDTDEFIQSCVSLNQLLHQLVLAFEKEYEQLRISSSELTISEMETLTFQIIQSEPETAKRFSQEYDFFMIDEFQDTSPLQVKILEALIQNKPHFIVGDPQQSIYLFRGARSEVFFNKQQQAEKSNYQVKLLDTNYRSRPELMNFMNDFFKNFSKSFSSMKVHPFPEKLGAARFQHQAYYIETENQINSALNQARFLMNQGAKPSDICILSSKNKSLIQLARQAQKLNYPVQLMVAAGFDEKREILDLVCFLRFLNNPFDSENLLTLLRSPWFQMTDQDLVQLRSGQREALWLQIKKNNHVDLPRLEKYLKDYQYKGVFQTLLQFIEDNELIQTSLALDSTGKREANIWKFVQSLREQMNHPQFQLSEYLAFQFTQLQSDLSSSQAEAQPAFSSDKMILMTVHNSKGLQFPHVIVLGMTDLPQQTKSMNLGFNQELNKYALGVMDDAESKIRNSFWTRQLRREFNERELAESERVLYVAMTRAIETVTLIAEDRKINYQTTWRAKSVWPEAGHHQKESFQIVSLRDTDLPQPWESLEKSTVAVPLPFQQVVLNAAKKVSISEIAKQGGSATNIQSARMMKNLNKARLGTKLHQYFEALKYKNIDDLNKSLSDLEKKYLSYLLSPTLEVPLRQILDQGYVEWGFGFLNENQEMIRGQIDAWGIVDNIAYIIDYKTGSSDYLDSAYLQLGNYALYLKRMQKIELHQQIKLVVIYPAEERCYTKDYSDSF